MILPLPLIARLHVSWLKKLGLFIIFCVGSFIIAIAGIRLVALRHTYEQGFVDYYPQDLTFWNTLQGCICEYDTIYIYLFPCTMRQRDKDTISLLLILGTRLYSNLPSGVPSPPQIHQM